MPAGKYRVLPGVLALALAGCSGGVFAPPRPAVTITAAQVFTPAMAGQRWTFRNGHGDLTQIDVESPAQAEAEVSALTGQPLTGNYLQPGDVIFHYTKKNCRAYWQPGLFLAELWFVLRAQPTGEVDSIASLINFPNPPAFANFNLLTTDVQPVPGSRPGFVIVPASGNQDTATVSTSFILYGVAGVLTFDSVLTSPAQAVTAWRTDAYVENVKTPAYSGPALVSEQWEGPCFPMHSACTHERWYFAPGLGLVKVAPLAIGSGQDDADPLLAMERLP